MEDVQEYKDMSKLTNEELREYINKPYRTKNNIIIECEYSDDGLSYNDHINNCLERKLKMRA